MAKSKVQVVERHGKYIVLPPTAVAEKNDDLTINNTTTQGLVFLMQGSANGPFGATLKFEEVAAKTKKKLTISNTAADGEYTYQIIMANGEKAVGNSDPSLIIDN